MNLISEKNPFNAYLNWNALFAFYTMSFYNVASVVVVGTKPD